MTLNPGAVYSGELLAFTKGDAVRHRLALAAVLVAWSFAAAASAADLTGTWIGKAETPDGADEVTLVLQKTGAGAYTGTVADSAGHIAAGTGIKNVSWADNVLTCSFALADGANIKLTLRLDGGKLTGNWVHEQGDSGAIALEKK